MTETPAPFTRRDTCACGAAELVDTAGTVVQLLDGLEHGAVTCTVAGEPVHVDAPVTSWDIPGLPRPADKPALVSELLDPVDVFTKLLRELGAARVLVQLSTSDDERRAAALDGLAEARRILADVAEAL